METLTLIHSMIRGSVAGKMINCSVRSSPAGLKVPAGQYLLRAAANNPVHGLVISIEATQPGGLGPSAGKQGVWPIKMAGVKIESPASKVDAPTALKWSGATIGAQSSKVDAPAALKFAGAKIGAPASKVDAPAALKWSGATIGAPASKVDAPAAKVEAPAIKFDMPANPSGAILMSDRAIAANCLVVTAGFGDLVDALRRAGTVTLVVT